MRVNWGRLPTAIYSLKIIFSSPKHPPAAGKWATGRKGSIKTPKNETIKVDVKNTAVDNYAVHITIDSPGQKVVIALPFEDNGSAMNCTVTKRAGKTFTPHWLKASAQGAQWGSTQKDTEHSTPPRLSANSTIINTVSLHHNTSYCCPQSCRICMNGLATVVPEILRGQNLLPGLSNYTLSSVPLWSLHHYFLTHGCLCCFIFYGYEIMEENRRECFSPALFFALLSYSGDKAMFHSSTGESFRRYKLPNLTSSSVHRESRDTWSLCFLL